MIFEHLDRIVFTGDSVTDMGSVHPIGEGLFDNAGHGYVRMVENRVVKCTKATEGKEVELEIGADSPSPLVQFLTGNVLDGCGMKEAKALTRMMTLAYAK